MIEFLKLCGFEDREIKTELPRIERAFKKLGINGDDIENGKRRLKKYYDIELMGVRKIFRLIMKELVNAMLVRDEGDKKVIYGFMAPSIDLFGTALMSQSKNVFSIHHSWALHVVVGCIFDKITPIIEEAEKTWLKEGTVAHCANVKTLVGPMIMGLFPKPDLLVTASFLCETAPKTLDLLHELYDIPICLMDACPDREINEYPEPPMRSANFTANSYKKLAERLQEITGFKITDDLLLEVLDAKDKLEKALSRVRGIVEKSDPLVISAAHMNIWNGLNALTLTLDGMSEALNAVNLVYDELQEKIAKGTGVVEKGAPRVLATLPAGQTDPRLEHLACEVGIAIVHSDTYLRMPFKTTTSDPYVKLSLSRQQRTLDLPMPGKIPMIIDECKRLKVDGLLNRYHIGCRLTVADAIMIEKAVKKELGIPVLTLEWESFDPRIYNHEEFENKLEVFKAMMVENRT